MEVLLLLLLPSVSGYMLFEGGLLIEFSGHETDQLRGGLGRWGWAGTESITTTTLKADTKVTSGAV